MPILVYRERLANSLKLSTLKAIFDECIMEWGDNSNFKFNPMVKHSDVFMKPRVAYMTEVLRQLAQISVPTDDGSGSRGTVAVVEHDLLPFIEGAWEKDLPRELRSLESLQREPHSDKTDGKSNDTYLEFVEKQVILDILFQPYI